MHRYIHTYIHMAEKKTSNHTHYLLVYRNKHVAHSQWKEHRKTNLFQ